RDRRRGRTTVVLARVPASAVLDGHRRAVHARVGGGGEPLAGRYLGPTAAVQAVLVARRGARGDREARSGLDVELTGGRMVGDARGSAGLPRRGLTDRRSRYGRRAVQAVVRADDIEVAVAIDGGGVGPG